MSCYQEIQTYVAENATQPYSTYRRSVQSVAHAHLIELDHHLPPRAAEMNWVA